MHVSFFKYVLIILRQSTKHAIFWLGVQFPLNKQDYYAKQINVSYVSQNTTFCENLIQIIFTLTQCMSKKYICFLQFAEIYSFAPLPPCEYHFNYSKHVQLIFVNWQCGESCNISLLSSIATYKCEGIY